MSGYRKAAVAVCGIVAQLVALGILTGSAQEWAAVVLAVGTAVGVYQVPNAA